MSLADALKDEPIVKPTRKGPPPACDIYGVGDLEDFTTLRNRRLDGEVWVAQQRLVDAKRGVTKRVDNNKFRYHWSGKCGHWDHLRDEIDAILEADEVAA